MSWWPPHLLLAFQHSIQLNTFGHLSARNWTVLPSMLLLLGIQSLPPQISGISDEERSQKEAGFFDRAIDQLCQTYWADATFDGYPVFRRIIPCLSSSCVTIMLFTSSFEHQYEILNHHKTTNSSKS